MANHSHTGLLPDGFAAVPPGHPSENGPDRVCFKKYDGDLIKARPSSIWRRRERGHHSLASVAQAGDFIVAKRGRSGKEVGMGNNLRFVLVMVKTILIYDPTNRSDAVVKRF